MDKTELRREIRARKRAMTEAEIEERSAKLAQLFFASEAYQNAKTIYEIGRAAGRERGYVRGYVGVVGGG